MMGSVYYLTIRQLTGRGRLLIMTVLAALPVLITLLMLAGREAPSVGDYEMVVLSGMFAGSIIPLVVLAIAGAAFSNEVEDRTLANLTLAPLARWQIVVPKLLGAVSVAAPFILLSAVVTSYAAFLGDLSSIVAVSVAALVAVALYGAAFLFLGLITTQAIGIGLLYIVLWEGFFAGFISGVRMLSIRYHTIGLAHALDPRRFAEWYEDHAAANAELSLPVVLAVVVLLLAAFIWLATRRLRRMDVP
jgi:ABC-2 type transport system permease protein